MSKIEKEKYQVKTNGFLEIDYSKEKNLQSIFLRSVNHGQILFDQNHKTLVYIPQRDFEGKDEISYTLKFDKDDDIQINLEVDVIKDLVFRPRARLIKIIGQELISNDVIALVELVKNSYDAEAKKVTISFNNITNEKGEIIVEDDGCGMTEAKIKNVWLEPATPDKRSKDGEKKLYTPCFERRYLGEKGIGRFAAHRLGEKIKMVTRASELCFSKVLPHETEVNVDWTKFSVEEYLDNIPVEIVIHPSPQIFKNRSGTSVKITSIHSWKENEVLEAVTKLRSLESPFVAEENEKNGKSSDPGFQINIDSNDKDLNKKIRDIKPIGELVDTAFYKFHGKIDSSGVIQYQYEFNRPDYQEIKRVPSKKEFIKEDLKSISPEDFENDELNNETTPGSFEVNFYAWDLETSALRIAGLADLHKNIIKPNAGVRIYRDRFRVWPYGEETDDWLGLDLKRLNRPRERSVSRNQIVGFVKITSIKNPQLLDQSNREGLIDNPQFQNFYNLVQSALSIFATERKKDKVKIDRVSETKKVEDSVTLAIRKLQHKVEKNKHSQLYKDNINDIEKNYKNKIDDVLERYMMAAAIGISYSIPIHEMKLRLTSIKHVIDDIQEDPKLQDKYLRELIKIVSETEDIVKAVSSIMSRQKRQKTNLVNVAKNSFKLKESELKKHDIAFEINGNAKLEADAVPGLLNTAVLNLVDNSIYWLRSQKLHMKEQQKAFRPKITIEVGEEKGKPFLKVKDNGPGFQDPFEILIEPYYSRKKDGLGLGLFLVKEIMDKIGGTVEGYNRKGAVVQLTFNK
jgi:signal transduction histidine kinase